ncbi:MULTISPECIES: WD40 repeat domain-containing serine/threonine protein kinase [Streptomyces]|uniref:WD40 repeat domain-containing serine/threonine protein kinase n=1 Tax=Streptomyces TaxID=1883 RepID=UPI00068E85A4|nr:MULTISPECIES: protein kinase [Streptomyces]
MGPGQLLGGRYRLVRLIGEGGMGQVWEAQDETLRRPVAVKVISPLAGSGTGMHQARARFLRETQLTARLQHPNIVTIHDFGQTEALSETEAGSGSEAGTVPYLVMELLLGEGLNTILRRGPVALPETARWGAQICDALAAVHEAGILHRDIKPSNILITQAGSVKVLDFGVARAVGAGTTAERLTQTGSPVGTPAYMAPEQAKGHPVPSSDLYAVGCLLFEMLTGHLPFRAPDAVGQLAAHLFQDPPPPSSVSGHVPPAWDRLVLTLLHKEPGQRRWDARHLAHALRRLDHPSEPTVSYTREDADLSRTTVLPPEESGAGHGEYFVTTTDGEVTGSFHRGIRPGEYVVATTGGEQTLPASSSEVRLWDPMTGRPIGQPLTGHTAAVWDLKFSFDGSFLATGSGDSSVRLWDTVTGKPLLPPLTGHVHAVVGVAVSPDGRLIASGGRDCAVRLWDTTTGRLVGKPLTGHNDTVVRMAFSPDGRLLATTTRDRTVRLWNPVRGKRVGRPLTGHTADSEGVAFSPDSRLLATTSRDWTVRLWDTATRKPVGRPLTGHSDTVWAVAFSPDGQILATSSGDGTVRLWDTTTGRLLDQPLTAPDGGGVTVVSCSGGLLLAARTDRHGATQLTDLITGRPFGTPVETGIGIPVWVACTPRLVRSHPG